MSQEPALMLNEEKPSPSTEAESPRRRNRVSAIRDYGIVIAFVALFIVLAIASPSFLSLTNMLNILQQNATIGIVACGVTVVLLAGGFDFSVGAIYGLAGVVAAEVAVNVDPWLGLLAGLVAGLGFGIVNGLIVSYLKVNTFIATLASGYVYRGIAMLITSGFLVSVAAVGFTRVGQAEVLSVRISILAFAVVAVVLSFVLSRTGFGRYVYAVGGNAEAARMSGVRVNLVRSATFAISGFCAGMAGVIAASRDATGQAMGGEGYELAAIAAVVVGGTSISGGEGAIWRSVLGVLLIALIGNGFNLLNINSFYLRVAEGLIILVAVAVDTWVRVSAHRT